MDHSDSSSALPHLGGGYKGLATLTHSLTGAIPPEGGIGGAAHNQS